MSEQIPLTQMDSEFYAENCSTLRVGLIGFPKVCYSDLFAVAQKLVSLNISVDEQTVLCINACTYYLQIKP